MESSMKILLFLLIVLNGFFISCYQYADDDKIIPYSTIRMRRKLFSKRRHRTICNFENDEKNNEKLREVVKYSNFVFTGKVLSYYEESKTNGVARKKSMLIDGVNDGDGVGVGVGGDNNKKQEKRHNNNNKKSKKLKSGKIKSSLKSFETNNTIDVNIKNYYYYGKEKKNGEKFVVEIKRAIKGGKELSEYSRVIVNVPKEFVSGVEITSDPTLNTNCVEFHPVLKIRSTAILLTKKLNGSKILELTYFPVAMTLRHLDKVDAAVTGRKNKHLFIYFFILFSR
ncbi:hypothetical protein Phum_PHUM498960 [Pediculus humanus corporis]|uniref:Uncharacterized protein n=1 Tax=Pediculus humanus subsp. corporis TaxID=121224 RepID=E0VXE3_PEDHC|nr:uncharacterized protein Phum_PHUM498960 [Pediculus humanus corporis]EEB18049.1 hypothetical protein Phum_PHUM498960 [Pediculus humanus corporis]